MTIVNVYVKLVFNKAHNVEVLHVSCRAILLTATVTGYMRLEMCLAKLGIDLRRN